MNTKFVLNSCISISYEFLQMYAFLRTLNSASYRGAGVTIRTANQVFKKKPEYLSCAVAHTASPGWGTWLLYWADLQPGLILGMASVAAELLEGLANLCNQWGLTNTHVPKIGKDTQRSTKQQMTPDCISNYTGFYHSDRQ